jgi:SAM-dependent methyltransferase
MADEAAESNVTHADSGNYDSPYFAARFQDRDRPALWFYERIIHRWIQPGTVLDYGCGTGFMLKRLARHYAVAGYDISPSARQTACHNLAGLTVYASEEEIPQGKYSGIVSLHVLEHIDQSRLSETLACWRNSLLQDGRVFCVIPDLGGRGHQLAGRHWNGFGDPAHVTLLSWQEWNRIFAAGGFSVNRVGTDGLWCLPYRQGKGKLLDGIRYSVPTLVQFLLGRLILPPGSGESAVFMLEKV